MELAAEHLQPNAALIKKIIELYESKRTRHGNMLVGESLAGKTTAWTALQKSLTTLANNSVHNFRKVRREEIHEYHSDFYRDHRWRLS